MPTYEYYCEENEKNVDVIHSMSEEITTWGELCDRAEIDCGGTPRETGVMRKLSTISLLSKKSGDSPQGGGCCGGGGGCGCGGH